MDGSVIVFIIAIVAAIRFWGLPGRLTALQKELAQRLTDQKKLQAELQVLREQIAQLREARVAQPPIFSPVAAVFQAPPVAAPVIPPVILPQPAALPETHPKPVMPRPLAPAPAPEPVFVPTPAPATEPEPAPIQAQAPEPTPEPVPALTPEPEPVVELSPVLAAEPVSEPAPVPVLEQDVIPEPTLEPTLEPESEPVSEPTLEPDPTPEPEPLPVPASRPIPLFIPEPLPLAAAVAVELPVVMPPIAPPPPAPPRRPPPPPVPTGTSWWERAATVLLENWTGILGAVVLVTGVGFLGIYAALRLAPPFRFLMICAFAGGLLGVRFALRNKEFARQLNGWLLSSAAAIFLFACVASVSLPGLQWATPPFDYLLLLAGVSANLWLAWRASRQEVSTLHGVLSLVALAVLPPTALTLAAAAGVTAFSIAITYRQLWKYQLLLSIASFFAFHLYWHQELAAISNPLRLTAMGLVLLVGVAAAVVQYRSVYSQRKFEPLLFAAHLLNWTCLGINLYLYSTGSIWKTIPLALGALLTFWAGRRARQLGIGWLFQTDTIISLMLALATAFSLQGWHATNSVILLFMLLESLLVALIMARQSEALVYRVALSGAYLAGAGLLLLAGSKLATSPPQVLYRDALVLALAGWAGIAFTRLIFKQPLLQVSLEETAPLRRSNSTPEDSYCNLLGGIAGLAGLLQIGAGTLLGQVLFSWQNPPVGLLLGALLGLGGVALGLATWVRSDARIPEWVRQQQLLLAQFFVLLAGFGLHETGLYWPLVLGLLYAENLVVALLAARQREALLYHIALGGAALAGASLLLVAADKAANGRPSELYRDAAVLALAGWAGIAFVQLTHRQLAIWLASSTANNTSAPTEPNWLSSFAGLAGVLQLGAGALLARVLFGWQQAPVGLLLGVLLGLGGVALGLAAWVRTSQRTPEWVRQQQLLLAQSFALLAVLGLHETGLSWPIVLGLLYAENLAVAFLATRRREALLHRVALGGAYLTGISLVLVAAVQLDNGFPIKLYRDAAVLALTGWAGIAFVRLAHRPLAAALSTDTRNPANIFTPTDSIWLNGFAALAGVLQAGAGVLLTRVVFAWQHAPVAGLIVVLLVLGGAAVGLAGWLRTESRIPAWVRQQQLLLGQFFAMLAVLSLHETGLSWPVVLGLLYAESLAVALLTASLREHLLYHVAFGSAFLTGTALLLITTGKMNTSPPATLYRDALMLALASWAGIGFAQFTHRLLSRSSAADKRSDQLQPVGISTADHDLLSGFAGLAGLLQVGTGLLLAYALFAWSGVPVGLLLGVLIALAGIALGLAAWVHATGLLPRWVRRQQLILGQFFAVLAVFGLHETGLTWPAVFLVLYTENLLVALLLNNRDEDDLLHIQTYLLVLQAALLPLMARYLSPETLSLPTRAALLAGAALLTVGYQLRRIFLRNVAHEFSVLQLGAILRIPALGLAVGWLLLSAGALVVERTWAGWAMVGLLGGLLYLRQRLAVPGLWAGLVLAAVGYLTLQWGHVLVPPSGADFRAGYVLLYVLPTLAVPVAGLAASWWPAGERYIRWPWLYLLALHLVVALVAAVPAHHVAYFTLGFLALAGATFAAAQLWRHRLPDAAAVGRAGSPDRHLLHVSYWALSVGFGTHLWLISRAETFFGQPAEYFTAAVLFGTLAAMAIARPPAAAPVYNSWRLLHPWLPEVTLIFGTATLAHNIRTPWLPLVWVSIALVLSYLATDIPVRFRRLGVYGRLYYWLAAGTASVACLLYLSPSQLLSPEWLEIAAAVVLLFGYVALALRGGGAPYAGLSPAWDMLARPPRRQLEAWLLYPAFLALTLLLIQSFDRSVLTVLLMLEVVAIFSTSLLLRRQDLRYLSLAGMLGCLVRLVFFDLSRSGTITRAIVFIFMGLLLLGMNALYARFKTRFAPDAEPDEEPDEEDVIPEPVS